MRRPSVKEKKLVNKIKHKWVEISNGLMQFTGTVKPLLLLEFQGYLDYLKVVEKEISFWELKDLSINHQVGPYYLNGRILKLDAKANLEVFTPGIIGPLHINLSYNNDDKKIEYTLNRWESIIEDL